MKRLGPWASISSLDFLKVLSKPRQNDQDLCQRILLTETDARTAIERQVLLEEPY